MTEENKFRRPFAVLIILAIGFIFAIQWGPGSRGCDQPVLNVKDSAIARVNGKEIPVTDFTMAYRNQLEYYRQRGTPIPESMARQFLPPQIVEGLVNQELWSQAAERHGIAPSDAELRKLIRNDQSFWKDGKFSMEVYGDILRDYYRTTIPDYENKKRRQLASFKMQDVVASGAVVSEDEVKSQFLQQGNKANVTFARFLPAMFASKVAPPAQAELDAYRKDHQKEVSDYYDANKALYEQEEQVHARHILVAVSRDAPKEQRDAAKAKAEKIKKELDGGKDFAAAAQEYSDDGSKAKGGDLGFATRTSWVPEFSEAAFSLAPGKVSDPVESQFGYHLIKVEEKKPGSKKELKDVEAEIATTLLNRDRAKQLAKAEADKAAAALASGKALASQFPPEKENQPAALRFETETRPEAVPTGEFSGTAESIPYLGNSPSLMTAVFAAQQPGPLPGVYDAGEGYAVAEVTARTLPSDEEFAKEKEKLMADAQRAKASELQQSFIKAFKKDAKVVTNDQAMNDLLDRAG